MGFDLTGFGGVADLLGKVVDKIFPDKTEADKAKSAIIQLQMSGELQKILKGADIVLAEVQGESWLQWNWRPILMLSITFIIVNNYVLYPYFSLFGIKAIILALPEDLWSLMKIGLGGYVVGRSAEKIVGSLRNGKNNKE